MDFRATAGSRGSTSPRFETYCKDETCRTYQDALANVERLAYPGSHCFRAATGSCGELRYITYSSGYVGYTQYFRASGALVGAQTWSDIEPRQDFGVVPRCTFVVERMLCGTARDAGG